MAHDYQRGTPAAKSGPRVLGAVGGVKDAPDGPTYTEAAFDDAGNLRVSDVLAQAILDQLIALNEKLDILIALQSE